MRTVFADASYWIALLDARDELHRKAEEITGQLGSFRIVTTEMVLVEFLNAMGGLRSDIRARASGLVTALKSDPNVVVAQ